MAELEFPLDLLDSRACFPTVPRCLSFVHSHTQHIFIERFCYTENTAESPSSEMGSIKSLPPEADGPVWRDQRK